MITKTSLFNVRDDFGQSRNITAREDVFLDESVGVGRTVGASNRVQEKDTVLLQQARRMLEVFREMPDTDMFEHADRNDAVETVLDGAVVAQVKPRLRGQTFLECALVGDAVLLLR